MPPVRVARRFARELLGYGRNADAHHPTSPPPDGRGAVDCMRLALADAGLEPAAVADVSADGTSTAFNDVAEAIAIRTVFGAGGPPVTSVKGVLGHAIGAAGPWRQSPACSRSRRGRSRRPRTA